MRASTSLKAVLFSGIGFTAMAMAGAASAQGTAVAAPNRPRGRRARHRRDRHARRARRLSVADAAHRADPDGHRQHARQATTSPISSTSCRRSPVRRGRPTRASTSAAARPASTRSTCATSARPARSILVNGRRSVASTITGLVDVNTIPQMLVERVEVVTGGASAAYGSDAVAGVVNFILDNDFAGLRIEADSGITSRGDGFNYSFSVAGGISFADGRGHFMVSGEIAHRDGIFDVADRDWNQTGFVRIQDPDLDAATSTDAAIHHDPAPGRRGELDAGRPHHRLRRRRRQPVARHLFRRRRPGAPISIWRADLPRPRPAPPRRR